MEYERFMKIAIEEAEISLREGNNGFGAVIVKDGVLIAASHDRDSSEGDPTSHAELNVIREASKKLGRKLRGCILISTHEPCPMCASAAVWSEIAAIVYGCSIQETLLQGRKRINILCTDIFHKSAAKISVIDGILKAECSVLYRDDVRQEIIRLRNADDNMLRDLNQDSVSRRTAWFQKNRAASDSYLRTCLNRVTGFYWNASGSCPTKRPSCINPRTESYFIPEISVRLWRHAGYSALIPDKSVV